MLLHTTNDPDLLGTVLMTEIREAIRIKQDELEIIWNDLQLDQSLMPKPRAAKDAFRWATPRRQTANNLTLIEYRGAAKPQHYTLACILLRSDDRPDQVALTHHDRAVIALTDKDELEVVRPGLFLSDKEQRYLDRIKRAFTEAKTYVDGSQIRAAIARLIEDASAIRFRDGVAMIPTTNQEQTERIVTLINALNGYLPETTVENVVITIGYSDTPAQRAQLKDQIREHIEREVTQKVVEAANYAQRRGDMGKTVGDGKRQTMVGDLLALAATIAEFERTLQEPLQELHMYLDMQKLLVEQALAA